jgi:group II intron reverse transcriptase/maturase
MNHKAYQIPKRLLLEAWESVRVAAGGAGVDGVTIAMYEAKLYSNLYKLWNRMSSGSYFPKPVKQVGIPKADGGTRLLGIPTVEDRIAQAAVRLQLEPAIDPKFHRDSYGCRPGRSAHQAVTSCRQRCWEMAWVVDLDIKKYFDSIPHELLLKAVEKHTTTKWELLYIKRWLRCEVMTPEGARYSAICGTPQGGVISPLLANLFLHYGFDLWMQRTYPELRFERYVDDIIIHCPSESKATLLMQAVTERFATIGLELNLDKSKLVHCQDTRRAKACDYSTVSFTFLGFDFKPRRALPGKGRYCVFAPAAGKRAKKKFMDTMRGLKIPKRVHADFKGLARLVNQYARGWINYFQVFNRSELRYTLFRLNSILIQWLCKKYSVPIRKAQRMLAKQVKQKPSLFAHWAFGVKQ